MLADRLVDSVRWEWKLLAGRPVIMYSMGKVGSSSIEAAIREQARRQIVKVHTLDREEIAQRVHESLVMAPDTRPYGYWRYDVLRWDLAVRQRHRRTFIAAVREPLARMASGHFYRLGLDGRRRETVGPGELEEHQQAIERAVLKMARQEDWFDREIGRTIGLDVYRQPFSPTSTGMEFRNGAHSLLVLRQEDPSHHTGAALSRFLNLDAPLQIERRNSGGSHGAARQYEEFLEWWRPSEEVVATAHCMKYMRYFYTAAEREEFAQRWLKS